MQSNPKVLILLAGYGDGHYHVSRALQQCFAARGVTNVLLVDLFAEAYPTLDALTKFIYVKSYTVMPALYGWTYNRTKRMRSGSTLTSWFHAWGMGKLQQIVASERPDVVINTFPVLAMPELCRRLNVSVPIHNVLTDFTIHSRWIHPWVDKYYVATEDLRQELLESGVLQNQVTVSGIPLKQSFHDESRLSKEEINAKYNLQPDKKTVLIMAGSYGVLQGLKALTRKLSGRTDTQSIIVCGKNAGLHEAMTKEFGSDPSYRIFGFVQNVHELMRVADCIVTKPGGVTLSEALHCELPILLYRPVPGQERENAVYLERKGAARIAHRPAQLAAQIEQLLQDGELRAAAQNAIRAMKCANAAERIVSEILNGPMGLQDQSGALHDDAGSFMRRFAFQPSKRKPGKAR